MTRRDHARILIYSHDTFGLGRLRQCVTVANSLVGQFKGISILIISGSQVPSGMGLRARVDFVKIPSIIKLYDGQYTSMSEHIDMRDTLAIRRTIVRNTAESFDPDVFIVDYEPFGLTTEIQETVEFLKSRKCSLVFALPDIIDATAEQRAEWQRDKVLETIAELYDSIWVYGTKDVVEPFKELDPPEGFMNHVTYTGYLKRNIPRPSGIAEHPFTNPYILVTANDSDPGCALADWVLTAYEHDATLPHPALLVLGPLTPTTDKKVIRGRAARFENVHIIEFDERIAGLMSGAVGVVAAPEYDTFCQVLSFDKRAIFVPQCAAGSTQRTRAERAADLNLASMLTPEEARNRSALAKALHELPIRPLPSKAGSAKVMGGIEAIYEEIQRHLNEPAVLQ